MRFIPSFLSGKNQSSLSLSSRDVYISLTAIFLFSSSIQCTIVLEKTGLSRHSPVSFPLLVTLSRFASSSSRTDEQHSLSLKIMPFILGQNHSTVCVYRRNFLQFQCNITKENVNDNIEQGVPREHGNEHVKSGILRDGFLFFISPDSMYHN